MMVINAAGVAMLCCVCVILSVRKATTDMYRNRPETWWSRVSGQRSV